MATTLKISRCPTCGSRSVRSVCRDWHGRHDGRRYTVPKLSFYECPDCGEKLYDRQAMRRIEACSPTFKKTRSTA